jgi:hypothetical protein
VRLFLPITVLSILSSRTISSSEVTIYEIVPTDADATFTLLRSLKFKTEHSDSQLQYRFYMGHNCVYLMYRQANVVWDFIGGRYCIVPAQSRTYPSTVSDPVEFCNLQRPDTMFLAGNRGFSRGTSSLMYTMTQFLSGGPPSKTK